MFSTLTSPPLPRSGQDDDGDWLNALVVLWSRDEPARVGEVVLVSPEPPGMGWVLGRDEGPTSERHQRLNLFRQRPGQSTFTGPLRSPHISREQLRIRTLEPGLLEVQNLGRGHLSHNELPADLARVQTGDVLEVANQLLLLAVRRPLLMPAFPRDIPLSSHGFGESDAQGFVGESPLIWELRRQLRFVAPRETHVLIQGASGTGKELAARAIHLLSSRGRKRLISRNAATFPETLIDAELFGNAKGYPNPGMVERAGLVGDADGSTLFLDEIGELPPALQAHLLRMLDQGEYQRLGETTVRRSDLRLIAATNRDDSALKHDFLARLTARVAIPDLNARREDIPLIARHLMREVAARDPAIGARYLEGAGPTAEPRFTPELLRALVQHSYSTHVRELYALLWQAMGESRGSYLERSDRLPIRRAVEESAGQPVDPMSLTAEQIQSALDRHSGVQELVCKELGLPNRFVLYRLIKKYDLIARR